MKINFFNGNSPLYPFRWFIVLTFFVVSLLAWYNLNGMRLFESNKQDQWNASGPGYHK